MKWRHVVAKGFSTLSMVLSMTGLSWSASDRLPQLVVSWVATPPVMDGTLQDSLRAAVPEEEVSCWTKNRMKFVELANLGELIIPDEGGSYCQIRCPRLAAVVAGSQEVPLEFINHLNTEVQPKVAYSVTRGAGAQISSGEALLDIVPVGGQRSAALKFTIEKPGSYKLLATAVDSASGKLLYSFRREMEATLPIVFDESLYAMYHQRADASVDVRVPPEGAKPRVSLIRDGSSTPVAERMFNPPFTGPVKVSFNLPQSAAGTYRLIAELVRKGKTFAKSYSTDYAYKPNPKITLNSQGFLVVDEAEGIGEAPVQPVRDLYQIIKEYDQDHPCAMVIMSSEAAKDYRSCTDIMWIDPYPVPKQPVTAVSGAISGAIRTIGKESPLWGILQAFDWSVWNTGKINQVHRPTADEERCMTYLALVNGAKGIIYWAYGSSKYYIEDYPEHWAAVKKIAGEVHDLIPVLMTDTIDKKLAVSQKSSVIQSMLKKYNGEWYVLAVNGSTEVCDAKFTLPGVGNGTRLSALFENRTLTVAEGGWRDSFKPLEVHVYKASAR